MFRFKIHSVNFHFLQRLQGRIPFGGMNEDSDSDEKQDSSAHSRLGLVRHPKEAMPFMQERRKVFAATPTRSFGLAVKVEGVDAFGPVSKDDCVFRELCGR